MTQEEKAKAYDRAFEKAKAWCKLDNNDLSNDDLETLFPSLKESEDERIRKEMIEIIEKEARDFPSSVIAEKSNSFIAWLKKQSTPQVRTGIEWVNTIDNACDKRYSEEYAHGEYCHEQSFKWGFQEGVDWLEKQGEQKHEIPIPRFNIGDWVIVHNKDAYQVIGFNTYDYRLQHYLGGKMNYPFKYESDLKPWTIQDAKDGDVLEFGDHGRLVIGIISHINTNTGKVDVSCLLEYDKFKVGNYYALDTVNPHPATKEQRNTLFAKMREAGYERDKEKKELKKIVDEEYNGEDYGIDSLWHAKNILEETLGKVDGYQTDDGILEHKCAIAAVNKLYKQKPDDIRELVKYFYNLGRTC